MIHRSEIEEFRVDLARMDGPLVGLLLSYFRAQGLAWEKLYRLGSLVRPDPDGTVPLWTFWHRDVPRRLLPAVVEMLTDALHDEVASRDEAALAARRGQLGMIAPKDAESLGVGELSAVLLVLTAPVDTLEARWRLLAALSEVGRGGLRPPTWPRWRRIASGPEATREASTGALQFEATRRGLEPVARLLQGPGEEETGPADLDDGDGA